MSSLSSRTRGARPVSRLRTRLVASAAAIALSGTAVVASAVPAQARARSCENIGQSMMFFWLAMESDTGAYAGYWAADNRMYNYEIRVYNNAGC